MSDRKTAKIYDFDIVANTDGRPSAELTQQMVRIEFPDCYFDIQVDQYDDSCIKIQKQHRLYPNTDQISILPSASNSIRIK